MNGYNFPPEFDPSITVLNQFLSSSQSCCEGRNFQCYYPTPAAPRFISERHRGYWQAVGHPPQTNPETGDEEMTSESWIQSNASGSGSEYVDNPNHVTDGQLSSSFTLSGVYNFYSKWPVRLTNAAHTSAQPDGVIVTKLSSSGSASYHTEEYNGYVTGASASGGGDLVWAMESSYDESVTLYEKPEDRPEYEEMLAALKLQYNLDSLAEFETIKRIHEETNVLYLAQQTTFTSWLIELYSASGYSTFYYSSWLRYHPRPTLALGEGSSSINSAVDGAINHTIDPNETAPTYETAPNSPELYKPTLVDEPLETYDIASIKGCRSTSNQESTRYPMYFFNQGGNECEGDPCESTCVGTCSRTDLCASSQPFGGLPFGGYITTTDKSFQIEENGFSFNTFKDEALDGIVGTLTNESYWDRNLFGQNRWQSARLGSDELRAVPIEEETWTVDIMVQRYSFFKPYSATGEAVGIGYPNALMSSSAYPYSVTWEEVWAAESIWSLIDAGEYGEIFYEHQDVWAMSENIETSAGGQWNSDTLSRDEVTGIGGHKWYYLGFKEETPTKEKIEDLLAERVGQQCRICNVLVSFVNGQSPANAGDRSGANVVHLPTYYGLQLPTRFSPDVTFYNPSSSNWNSPR